MRIQLQLLLCHLRQSNNFINTSSSRWNVTLEQHWCSSSAADAGQLRLCREHCNDAAGGVPQERDPLGMNE